MDKVLLRKGIQDILANKGRLHLDFNKNVIALKLKLQQEDSDRAYYLVDYIEPSASDEYDYAGEYKLLMPLTAHQIDMIKQAAIIDGEEVDYDEVLDQFSEDGFLYARGACADMIPVHIDLEHPLYLYAADVAVFFNGINNEPEIIKRSVELTNEEYIWLVNKYMIYPNISFNEIRTLNNDLYNKMCGNIEANIEKGVVKFGVPAYTAELTQIKADAAELSALIEELSVNS